MAKIQVNETCEFETKADQIRFRTQTNGDRIHIEGVHLTQEQATSLAWLVNADDNAILKVEIKVKDGG